MELRRLRYFVAVAEASSFTNAAQNLRLAQSSLTRQVRNFENEIGVRLRERIHNHVTLTGQDQRFLFDSKKVLAMCAGSAGTTSGEARSARLMAPACFRGFP